VPDTFQALAVFTFAVLPGAMFVYALERQTGAWGIKAADRVLRFLALSAVLYVLLVPFGYVLFRRYVLSGHLATAKPFPWGPYLALVGYLGALPWLLGTLLGRAIEAGNERIARMFGHQVAAPRAFDYLFNGEPTGYVRILLKDVDPPQWIAGCFTTERTGRRAYVATYPEEPDIYLPVRVLCNPRTGAFLRDQDGNAILEEHGILVSGGGIAYLEFIDG
jgi:hypothetical protein